MFEPLDSKTAIPRALGHLEVSNYILDQLIAELRNLPQSDRTGQDQTLCRSKSHLNSLIMRMEWLTTATSSAKSAVKFLIPMTQFLERVEAVRALIANNLPNLRGGQLPREDMDTLSAAELVAYGHQAFHQMKENLEGIRRYMNVLSAEQIEAACARLRNEVGALSGNGRPDAEGSSTGGTKLTGTDS